MKIPLPPSLSRPTAATPARPTRRPTTGSPRTAARAGPSSRASTTRARQRLPGRACRDRAPPAGGDAVTLTASPWSDAGGGGFDGEAPGLRGDAGERGEPARPPRGAARPCDRRPGRAPDRTPSHRRRRTRPATSTETVDDVAERLGAEPATVERVLRLVQGFEPPGVAARDLAECLAIQLREQNRFDPAMAALVSRLDLVARRDLPALKRLCGVDDEDLAEMLAEIRAARPEAGPRLRRQPGRRSSSRTCSCAPRPTAAGSSSSTPDTLPRVLINQSYYASVSRTLSKDADKAFLTECLQTANWLTRSPRPAGEDDPQGRDARSCASRTGSSPRRRASAPAQPQDRRRRHRHARIDRVAGDLEQGDRDEPRHLRDEVLLHRRDPRRRRRRGPFLRGGAAPHPAAHRGRGARRILSDDALVQKLRREGIDIARRTVAKYRESLRIPSSIERRRESQSARPTASAAAMDLASAAS